VTRAHIELPKLGTKNLSQIDPAHIYSLVNEKFEIDKILANQSRSVFDIDRESIAVLQVIARNGPLNEYQIAEKIYNVTRDAVRRRIYGTVRLPSLLKQSYLTKIKSKKFKTGKQTKTFGLTLKGILASLAMVNFEDIYLINDHFKILGRFTDNTYNIVDFAILYCKYHIGLVLTWYNMMNFDLTFEQEPAELFNQGMKNYFLYGVIPREIYEIDWENYLEIGKRLFVLENTLIFLLGKVTSDPLFFSKKTIAEFIKHRPEFKKQITFRNFLVNFCLRDWRIYLDLRLDKIDPSNIPIFEYGNGGTSSGLKWVSLNSDMNNMKNKIFKLLKIKNNNDVKVGKIILKKSNFK